MTVYVHKNGVRIGPLALEVVNARLLNGELSASDPAWTQGWAKWGTLESIPGITLPAEPPPFPPATESIPPPLMEVVDDETSAGPTTAAGTPVPVADPVSPPVIQAPANQPLQVTSDFAPAAQEVAPPAEAVFFYIPRARLILMCVLTLGVYQLFWQYRNWRYVQKRDRLDISPFWRSLFAFFFVYSLLKAIRKDREANRRCQATFAAGGLAAAWIIAMIIADALSRQSDTMATGLSIGISCVAATFFLPVQDFINAANEAMPDRPRYHGWSSGQIIFLIGGLTLWPVMLYGLLGAT